MAKFFLYLTLVVSLACLGATFNVGDPCSPTDPYDYGKYHPHPYDCHQFLHCVHEVFRARNCPPGLHFNAEEQVCDWPSEANCGGETTPSTPTQPPTTTTTTESTAWPPSPSPTTEEYYTEEYYTDDYSTEDSLNR